ncbi:MAG: hypothetical protein O8C63_01395 [Candidatus Methanoperedens sp.]|nr:hypothetical protein [Candidatus Methanoperedens sp.]
MGRIQVVLNDETEEKFRDALTKEGKVIKGVISEEIETLIKAKLSFQEGKFSKQENIKIDTETLAEATKFYDSIDTLEKKLNYKLILLHDKKTDAIYTECHILAETLAGRMDIDVPIDPDFQPQFRANRDFRPHDLTYIKMVEDSKHGRQFSDIIIEYDTKHEKAEKPLKILGGQHRSQAIKEALPTINRYHGVRVYFNLNKDKRTELYVVSNTNIDVPPDLLDRLEEQGLLPPNKLREFAWEIGLLEAGRDFSERKATEEDDIPVKTIRTFIINFYDGKNYNGDFDNEPIIPELCMSRVDDEGSKKYKKIYEQIKENILKPFKDQPDLLEAGKNFVKLHKKQFETINKKTMKGKKEFRSKALTPSIISGWAFAAGVLQQDKTRLEKLYHLPEKSGTTDPLNVEVLRTSKLEDFDSPTYRGLGTRSSPTERGRILKLFLSYSRAKKDKIDKDLSMYAIQKYHADESKAKTEQAEKRALA